MSRQAVKSASMNASMFLRRASSTSVSASRLARTLRSTNPARTIARQNSRSFSRPATYFEPMLQHAAAHLVALDRLEQRLEIALAEAFVALALDDLEEDRPDAVLREDLEELALLGFLVGVDQDLVLLQARHVLAVVRNAHVDDVVVG